mgnify:CR=1 FL=1
MRNFHVLFGLGKTFPCAVEESSSYPQAEEIGENMGKSIKTLNVLSTWRSPVKSRKRRNRPIFHSIPNPYYDDEDHV